MKALGQWLNAEQALQVLPQDRFLFSPGQALQAIDPLHRRVEAHVVGPIASQDDSVSPPGINNVAQCNLAAGKTVLVELF